jgi:hypothetical protein
MYRARSTPPCESRATACAPRRGGALRRHGDTDAGKDINPVLALTVTRILGKQTLSWRNQTAA